ncbi:fatty acid desaturase [bacterium]|nr:fatty acid desaturase [bacterium]
MEKSQDFHHSELSEPHRDRTRAIMKNHPEIRDLIGREPRTFYAIAGIVALQVLLAVGVSNQPWWLVVAVAYLIGAFANHGLFTLIHECSHDLIFKRRWQNQLATILADLPNIIPSAISFRRYHIKHHSFQGVYDLDADLPSRWEAKLVGRSAIGKALWLLIFPVFQALRPPRLREIKFSCAWTVTNILIVFSFNSLIFAVLGPKALIYLLLSLAFAVGLHPLGARWIQEHYVTNYPQETYSYYGPLNLIAFNVGYHNEHHDFPSVPWSRLPQIRKAAPEYYDTLVSHDSWSKLLCKFLFDRNISLFSRVERQDRGGLKLETALVDSKGIKS